ncbi:MAG TPA: hypothetical protein VFZ66_29515 [Herpetosiphonaceae bacterium]
MAQGTLGPRGALHIRRIKRQSAPLAWKLANTLRWGFLKGWIAYHLIAPFANAWGVATMIGKLSAVVIKADGQRIHYGTLGYRVVTTAGVGYLVDAFQNATELENLKYHGVGTGSTAEASGDTALVTESTTALNPDSTRATGSTTEGASANIYRTVGTLTADAQIVAREHGIFSQAATGGGTLLDRTVFAAITLESGDSLQTTYDLTCSAGG